MNNSQTQPPQSAPGIGSPSPRWKMMDVVFLDIHRGPRGIVLDSHWCNDGWSYTVISQGEGYHITHECYCMTLDEWREWFERFRDELTGRDFREILEAAEAPFIEPDFWAGYRARYAATGDPWLHPENRLSYDSAAQNSAF